MPRIPNSDEMTALEILIDQCGLYEVTAALSVICSDKADHIRASYSDNALARKWTRASHVLQRAATHDSLTAVS